MSLLQRLFGNDNNCKSHHYPDEWSEYKKFGSIYKIEQSYLTDTVDVKIRKKRTCMHEGCQTAEKKTEHVGTVPEELIRVMAEANGEMLDIDIEKRMAKLLHKNWMEWSKALAKEEDLSEERLDRWQRLWETDWENLSEEMKEKDLKRACEITDKSIGLQKMESEEK